MFPATAAGARCLLLCCLLLWCLLLCYLLLCYLCLAAFCFAFYFAAFCFAAFGFAFCFAAFALLPFALLSFSQVFQGFPHFPVGMSHPPRPVLGPVLGSLFLAFPQVFLRVVMFLSQKLGLQRPPAPAKKQREHQSEHEEAYKSQPRTPTTTQDNIHMYDAFPQHWELGVGS